MAVWVGTCNLTDPFDGRQLMSQMPGWRVAYERVTGVIHMAETPTEMRASLEEIDRQMGLIDERTESGTDINLVVHAVHDLVRIVDNLVIRLGG
jgi:hypothetical protein